MIRGTTTLVGLLRDPRVDSLSPPMQNAAFAALALDVAYVPLGVPPDRLEEAVRGLVALGFLGANVTTPHKRAIVPLCDEVEGAVESVNTLVIRDGRVLGSTTDTAALGERRPARAAVIGAGGAAAAWIAELRRAGQRSRSSRERPSGPAHRRRRARRPRDAGQGRAALRAKTGPDRDRPRLPRRGGATALAAAARATGCDLVDGLDVLVAQGAASFERWTGLPAPVDVMRAAVRSGA